jgi:hypothetical protein
MSTSYPNELKLLLVAEAEANSCSVKLFATFYVMKGSIIIFTRPAPASPYREP